MYVCLCNTVTDHAIRSAITDGCQSIHDLRCKLGVATQCGRCKPYAQDLLQEKSHALLSRNAAQHSMNTI